MATNTPFPVRDPIAEKDGLINPRWQVYFRDLAQVVAQSPTNVVTPVSLSAQDATIGTTPFPAETLNGGLYRGTYYGRVTTAAGVSSDFTVSFSWTDGTVTCSTSFPIVNGNATAITGSGTYLMQVDPGSPISYSVTYNSTPASAMKFDLALVLEQIGS